MGLGIERRLLLQLVSFRRSRFQRVSPKSTSTMGSNSVTPSFIIASFINEVVTIQSFVQCIAFMSMIEVI
jgi:hypothetical protein